MQEKSVPIVTAILGISGFYHQTQDWKTKELLIRFITIKRFPLKGLPRHNGVHSS